MTQSKLQDSTTTITEANLLPPKKTEHSELLDAVTVSHTGHRQRLRRRFIANGLDGFSEHEALELLLFRFIPRVDTNPIAHELINRFGSLKGVICASESELYAVKGMTRRAARALTAYGNLSKMYADHLSASKQWLGNVSALWNEAKAFRADSQNNEYAFVLLNDKNYYLGRLYFSANSNPEYMQNIYYRILDSNVRHVVLVRFTDKSPTPLDTDVKIATDFFELLSVLSVYLIEVMVLSDDAFYSYRAASDGAIDFEKIMDGLTRINSLSLNSEQYDPYA